MNAAGSIQGNRSLTWLIIILSVLIPAVIAMLYFLPKDNPPEVFRHLPAFNALINGTTFILLVLAWRAILKRKRETHRRLMLTSLCLSTLFLISYVTYHSTYPSTSYGGEGILRYIYYFILISHILLSVVIVPLVLITLVRAFRSRFDSHRKLGRLTMPLWLYVALTGVLVYLLISPYY